MMPRMGTGPVDLSYLGEPNGMRVLAAEFTSRAESISEVARSLTQRVDSITFEGPAGLRLHDEMRERNRRAERAALELQEMSLSLRRGAAQIEGQIEEVRAARARQADLDQGS